MKDIETYLDGMVVADALPYAKIFDLSQGRIDFSDNDMMLFGARIRAYTGTAPMGPLAIAAASPAQYEQARLFTALADAQRQIRVFREHRAAEKWLDGLKASP